MRVQIHGWGAWSPGLESANDWLRWARSPNTLQTEGAPDLSFLPALLRRRCSRLTKMMLRAGFDATPEALRARVRTVYASRHGAIHLAVRIINSIHRGDAVSPMQFTHSVHNASAGTYSIATGNRAASASLAGGVETFASAFLEAALFLQRDPAPVLLVIGDEPVPELFQPLVDEPSASYALALLLGLDGPESVEFSLQPRDGKSTPPRKWPDALEFLRWWLCSEKTLELSYPRRRWTWHRT